jgi:hypothetical protein
MSHDKPKQEPKQEKPQVDKAALAQSIKDKKKVIASNQIVKK